MAGPKLPTSVASSYPDSRQDDSIRLHQQHHDVLHRIVNQFDERLGSAAVGDVLTWNGGAYFPRGPGLRINRRADSVYTLTRSDAGQVLIALSSSEPTTVRVPADVSLSLPIGSQIHLAQMGTGSVTLVPEPGVVIGATPGLRLLDQYAGAELIKISGNTWWAVGRLTA